MSFKALSLGSPGSRFRFFLSGSTVESDELGGGWTVTSVDPAACDWWKGDDGDEVDLMSVCSCLNELYQQGESRGTV